MKVVHKINIWSVDINLCRYNPAQFLIRGRVEILYSANGLSWMGQLSGFGVVPT